MVCFLFLDCSALVCTEPNTNTPPGSPCGCVLPMQVELRLSVALYTFFPLVTEFAKEIASGVFMVQSQVRIMGANAASQQPEKTIVLIDLVPLGEKFDNTTAFLTYQRFWSKEVVINNSFFGDYEVIYVKYPGNSYIMITILLFFISAINRSLVIDAKTICVKLLHLQAYPLLHLLHLQALL